MANQYDIAVAKIAKDLWFYDFIFLQLSSFQIFHFISNHGKLFLIETLLYFIIS